MACACSRCFGVNSCGQQILAKKQIIKQATAQREIQPHTRDRRILRGFKNIGKKTSLLLFAHNPSFVQIASILALVALSISIMAGQGPVKASACDLRVA
jgi:hypothetical protein